MNSDQQNPSGTQRPDPACLKERKPSTMIDWEEKQFADSIRKAAMRDYDAGRPAFAAQRNSPCQYDWSEPRARLVCIAPHKHPDRTVIVQSKQTLLSLLKLGMLTGAVLQDALAAERPDGGAFMELDRAKA